MSDGSGGAPQLDERAQMYFARKFFDTDAPTPWQMRRTALIFREAPALAASSGAEELDPSSEERRAMVKAMMERGGRTSSLTTRELCEWWLEAALDALVRARLDRKDDEQ